MGHILTESQDAYYDKSRVEDHGRLLGLSEERIKHVEEALAKYKTIDEAINEIRKLNVENRLKWDVVKDSRRS